MTTDLTAQIHQYLTSAPSSLFAQQQVEIIDHWEGDANLLWRVRVANQQRHDCVVKLFLDAGQARSRRQFDAHTLFAPRGLAPQPLWADRYPHGLSRQLIVYRWSDGEPILLNDPSALWAWAEAIATLHATPTDEVRRVSPHPLNLDYYWRIEQGSIAQISHWLAPSGLAITGHFQRLAVALETFVQASLPLWTLAQPTPVHGDLSREHTLIDRGRILLLDWEMFGIGDPALDVARLLQREAQTLEDDEVDEWLARYTQIQDQPAIRQRIDSFRRLLEVHNVVYLLVGLQQNTAGAIDADLRAALTFMQSALTTAFDNAAAALSLPGQSNSEQNVADFITWLTQVIPTSQGDD